MRKFWISFYGLGLLLGLSSTPAFAEKGAASNPFYFDSEEDDFGYSRSYGFYASRLHVMDGRLFGSSFFSPSAPRGQGKPGGNPPPPPGPGFPNDPYYWTSGSWGQSYADLWGIKRINADDVWGLYKGAGIRIAIVDTGLLFNHEDLSFNTWTNSVELNGIAGFDDDGNGYIDDWRGWDFVDNDNNPSDLNGHGTHVAGIAAASGNNGKGIIGVAPSAQIIGVRVLNQSGSGTFQGVANGIRYAASVGAKIINLSLGATSIGSTSFSILQSAINFARNLGSIIVAAAGNSNADVDNFSPANMDGVIAVGATNAFDNRASFSNFGSSLWIAAPGVDILSLGTRKVSIGTALSSNYYRASGTSMAAPFVTGAIALILNKYPFASFDDIKNILALGAIDLGGAGWDPYYGYGLLDVAGSLNVTLGSSSSSSTSSEASVTSSESQSAALNEIFQKQELRETLTAQREDIEEAGATLVQSQITSDSEYSNR